MSVRAVLPRRESSSTPSGACGPVSRHVITRQLGRAQRQQNDVSGVTVKSRGSQGLARDKRFTGWIQFGAGSARGSDIPTTTDEEGRTSIRP